MYKALYQKKIKSNIGEGDYMATITFNDEIYDESYATFEQKMNEAIELVMAKSEVELQFDVFTVYQDFHGERVSRRKVDDNFTSVTFGESLECEEWYTHRIKNKNWLFYL